jgi:2-polyprenyl-3-methyl-5-hydroxy-6-metoxy-1,4-benzoquinol methylase
MSAAGVHDAQDAAAGYFEHVRPELLALVPEAARTVVDVGCGTGALGAAIKARQGARVIGLELVPEAAEVAGQRLDLVVRADLDALEELPLDHGSVDAFVFGDVLEHLRDPQRLLTVVRAPLAPDGVIVCSIPNVRHWSVVGPLLVEDRFTYTQAGLLDRTHVHLFTLEEIDHMLRAAGYAVTQVGCTTHAMPASYAPLAQIVGRYGGDVDQAAARLQAYQYLVVARRAD